MTLYWKHFLFLLLLQNANCSYLLPKHRLPKKYSLPSAPIYLPPELPEDIYENIIEERPDLEPILSRQRREQLRQQGMKLNKEMFNSSNNEDETTKSDDEEVLLVENDDDDITRPLSEFNDGRSTESAKIPPSLAKSSMVMSKEPALLPFLGKSRKAWVFYDPWDYAWRVSSCYMCNRDDEKDIPTSPVCHRMFQSDEWVYRTMGRFFRTVCYYNWYYRNDNIWRYKWYTWYKTYDYPSTRGLTLHRIGAFTVGCFKRYIDISDVYTVRGCRSYWPMYIGGLARSRMIRLQLPLIDAINTTCITSPTATLTPFHRGISLFARYHVCVCKNAYCNKAITSDISIPLLINCTIFMYSSLMLLLMLI